MSQTISLKGEAVRKEAVAGGAITPGMLVQGYPGAVVVHAVAAGNARAHFALENDLIGGAVADDYASGDTVQIGAFAPGAEVFAILASGQNVTAVGTALVSAGNGRLEAFVPLNTSASDVTIPTDNIVAYALEAVNATSAAARIKVEVA